MSKALSGEHLESSTQSKANAINRVLVVDDSRLQRRILAGTLKRRGYQVVEAESGEAAMEICKASLPDLVLSDWMMPGMNGLEFCRAFRDLSADEYSYFILLTSKSEKNEVAQGLDAGADDFLTKPVNSDELRARISAGARILEMQRELSEKNRVISDTLGQLQTAYDTIDSDLIQAKKIQESLVPDFSRSFGPSQVSLLLKPCGHIGGDLVGMFSPDQTKVGFYSIDVSGHGITSAMMTARLGGYLSSTYFDQNIGMDKRSDGTYALREPKEVADCLNERLLADSGIEEYFTMVYGLADLQSGVVKLVQAGHPHPVILRATGSTEYVGGGGVPIGLLPRMTYDQFEVNLQDGDRLLLYSDGFTEARLSNGQMLEQEGLTELLANCQPGQPGRELLDDLFWSLTRKMVSQYGMEDDVSAALFEFNATQNPAAN